MSDQAQFGIAIVGHNKVEKGARAAERRLGQVSERVSRSTRGVLGSMDATGVRSSRSFARTGRGIVSTFSQIERASASTLAGSGGVISRLSSVATIGQAAGTSLGEAAVSGGLLSSTLGVVATGGALVAGVLVGVAYATDKLVGSWAKGVVGAANLANTVGIATKSLQEFQGVGERMGIDKNTSAGALAGLTNTLNDSRYGRNPEAAAMLAYLKLPMKLNKDGTVDSASMLPAIADAMTRQNASGAQRIARAFGIGDAALPMFRRGGRALAEDMADVGRHGNVIADGEEAQAKSWLRKRTALGQMAERGGDRLAAAGARSTEGMLDAVQRAGASTIDSGGRNILRGAEQFNNSVVRSFEPAVQKLVRAVEGWQGGGRLSTGQTQRIAQRALPLYRKLIAHGDTADEAAAWAATIMAESGGNPNSQQGGKRRPNSNLGYGLMQWDRSRRADFERVIGRSIYGSSVEDQLRFRDWELSHKEGRAGRKIDAVTGAAAKADAITRHYERPAEKNRDAADRANVASAIDKLSVDVTVKDDGRHRATVRRRKGTSYALGHSGD